MTKAKRTYLALLAILLSPVAANADPILASFDNPSVFFGQDQSLGYAFSSDTSATITALGFWDSGGDGFAANHEVGIWDAGGTLLGLVNLSAGTSNTLIGDFRYADLASAISLVAGATYFIAGTTAADDWVFQASNIIMDTGFNYLGSYFYSPSGNVGGSALFPNTLAADREYMTVNAFASESVSVPEPGTLALLGIGLLGIGATRRKRT